MRTRGFRVGKIFGVDILLDGSWFLVAFLITWLFAGILSDSGDLRLSEGAYFAMGVLAAIVFFASLLAHEMSHALVARSRGIGVRSITLFVFGGVAQITKDPETPGDEFKVAVVGPVTSLVLGGLLVALAYVARAGGVPVAAAIFGLTGSINVALAIFNLLPGFPLDGGRLLRAAVWRVTGDVVRATRVASVGGQVVAALLIGYGLFQIILRGALVDGLWLILIGLFLNQAATSGLQQLIVKRALEGVYVKDLMSPDPVCIPGNLRLDQAVDDYFLVLRHSAFPVIGYADQAEGIVTLQLLRSTPREKWPDLTIRQIMIERSPEISTTPDEPADSLMQRMDQNPAGRFLVMDSERLVGILSSSDVARHLRVQASVGHGGP